MSLRPRSSPPLRPALVAWLWPVLAGPGVVQAVPPPAPQAALTTAANPVAGASPQDALARAREADLRADTAATLKAAQAAVDAHLQSCAAPGDCDWRTLFESRLLLAHHHLRQGLSAPGLEQAEAAAALAQAAGDTPGQAVALALAAVLHGAQGLGADEDRLLNQALRLARLEGSASLRAQVAMYQGRVLRRRGDLDGSRQAVEGALALLAAKDAPLRLRAQLHVSLSDVLVAQGRPQAALKAAEAGLALSRRAADVRSERALAHNAALARIALGQLAQAKSVVEQLLAAYRASGASADEVLALHEFAEAFARAGHLRPALALYHRERELAAQIMAANRDAALAELRRRNDHEAQQRRLDLLARESRLMTARIENRSALQQVWAAGAAALLLGTALLALMLQRVRRMNRRLQHNQAFLRAQSHRDPLTGLANRRGLQEGAAARGLEHEFEGALLLVDIDHFKRVNDEHGHAAGDSVLVEAARRLAEVVRDDDLLARWGGEEFLFLLPRVRAGDARALAQRILLALGQEPVTLPGGGSVRITASVGYAAFPLPPARLPLSLERAINLADMALYTAKNQGRNLAIGIVRADADSAQALAELEGDFDRARAEGRVLLDHLPGPLPPVVAGKPALRLA